MLLCRSFLAGVVAGMRSMTAPAVVSNAAHCGSLRVKRTPFAFLASRAAAITFTALAAGEMIADKLPMTPDRREPPSFAFRIASGAFCGAAIGASERMLVPGLIAGAAGAVAGTLGGAAARGKMAAAFGCDLPAALSEDAAAVGFGVAAIQLPS